MSPPGSQINTEQPPYPREATLPWEAAPAAECNSPWEAAPAAEFTSPWEAAPAAECGLTLLMWEAAPAAECVQ